MKTILTVVLALGCLNCFGNDPTSTQTTKNQPSTSVIDTENNSAPKNSIFGEAKQNVNKLIDETREFSNNKVAPKAKAIVQSSKQSVISVFNEGKENVTKAINNSKDIAQNTIAPKARLIADSGTNRAKSLFQEAKEGVTGFFKGLSGNSDSSESKSSKESEEEKKGNENSTPKNSINEATSKAASEVRKVFNQNDQVKLDHPFGTAFAYSYLDFWIPSKIGFQAWYNSSAKTTYEFEYLSGSVAIPFIIDDIGEINDRRISILKRNFSSGGSFNWYWGIAHSTFKLFLGNTYASSLMGAPTAVPVNIQNLNLSIGIGNRWTLKNRLTFGVDWVGLNVPVLNLKQDYPEPSPTASQSDKDTYDDTLKFFKQFPTFYLGKVFIGYTF